MINQANSNVTATSTYKNGALLTFTSQLSEPIDTNSGNSKIGTNEISANNLDGVIGEIIIYNSILTTLEREDVEAYLSQKWGIDLNS